MPRLGFSGVDRLPLLPYERQLIEALQCSEEEYREYRRGLVNAGRRRPAEYAHIPDIVNDPTTVAIVQLVVGVLLTAASVLLAPKPKEGQKTSERREKRLADLTGPSRFNNTSSFDAAQAPASLGTPIPIPFGKYQQIDLGNGRTQDIGGISVSPPLVWSRMFSYGSHQGFKALYMIGEEIGGTVEDRPETAGIAFGTTPLGGITPSQFAVYWKTWGRPQGSNLIYGTRAYPAAGDPEVYDDPYLCPISGNAAGMGFCMTLRPNSDTQFGIFSPIRNGNGFRLNWRVVSLPQVSGKDDPEGRIKDERKKICYFPGREDGMPGVGTGYTPLCGIISVNGQEYPYPTPRIRVKEGDTCVYLIKGKDIRPRDVGIENSSSDITGDDVDSQADTFRISADAAMQVGETFMIGRTLWQVYDRGEVWQPERTQDVRVTLKCIGTTTSEDASTIGAAGRLSIYPGNDNGDRGTVITSNGKDLVWENGWTGQSFYPINKYALGIYRNTRPTDMTEFGIRSQVWNRASGLCNFSDLPDPARMEEYDEEGYSISNGTVSKYFTRTSVFTIWLRPVTKEGGTELPWQFLGEQFCVTSATPQDKYNYIRIKSNSGPREMEYRFVPKSIADMAFHSPDDAAFIQLDANAPEVGQTITTNYGTFRVSAAGRFVNWKSLLENKEFLQGYTESSTRTVTKTVVTDIENTLWYPTDVSRGRAGGFAWSQLGDPEAKQGQSNVEGPDIVIDSYGGRLRFRFVADSRRTDNADYISWYGMVWWWENFRYRIVSVDEGWKDGDTFLYKELMLPGNKIAEANYLVGRQVGFYGRVSGSVTTTTTEVIGGTSGRKFEERSQMSELSYYSEVTKSCDQGPEHEIVYVNESIGNDDANVTYAFTNLGVAVRSSSALTNVDQLRVWLPHGVTCKRMADGTFGPSNLFSDLAYYLLQDRRGGLGQRLSALTVDVDSFTEASKYLEANKIFFDGALEDKVNVRDYLTEFAPLNLCNFSIKNGIFGVVPALPYDSNYKISDKVGDLPIQAMFNSSNIEEGSYQLTYLDAGERQNFRAIIEFRSMLRNQAPTTETVFIRWSDSTGYEPIEVFDLTAFCSNRDQALMTGRYLLSIRRRIDHSISFRTSPEQLGLAPGNYIKVATEAYSTTPYSLAAVNPDTGEVLSAGAWEDGMHTVLAYVRDREQVDAIEITIENGRVTDESLWGTVFGTLVPRDDQNTYLVEQVELTDEGMVQITASHYPTSGGLGPNEKGDSIIAKDVLDKPYADGSNRFIYGV